MHERTLRDRFLRDDPMTRLGNIAANLARISRPGPVPASWGLVLRNSREGKYFIEWTALDSPPELLETLQTIQLRLCQIEQAGPEAWAAPKSDQLRQQMSKWSDQLVAFYLEHKGQPT